MNKKIALISVIVVILLIAILTFVLLLPQLLKPKTNTNQDGKNNVAISYPDSDKIDIFDDPKNENKLVDYAYITQEDTIALTNTVDKPLVIQLDHRKWSSLTWSPDGNLLAVYGISDSGVKNLYVYDVSKNQWSQATTFAVNDVDSFVWKNNKIILFTQGVMPDRWLHEYNYSSGQVLKISRIDGQITDKNSDSSVLLVRDSIKKIRVVASSGEVINKLENIYNRDTKNKISITNVRFSNNVLLIEGEEIFNSATSYPVSTPVSFANSTSEKLNSFYKMNIREVQAVRLNITNNLQMVCNITSNIFLLMNSQNLQELTIATINTDSGTIQFKQRFFLQDLSDLDLKTLSCNLDDIFARVIEKNRVTKWIKIENLDKVTLFKFFDNIVEVKPR